ncbi:YIP1 family protein [Sporosarcina sp. ACRSL]|uniref:YIP1 family protein n=1 Tax=Sporosarcina sp. ACRSL TaxID=2918215 RepID=UPI001EF4A978|nr:YIP1 family protein [Sporosarcina sp. ACRSL]MCG7346123.1 YIP1 family protein [Sporosarcina sp. ACRSL]
MNPLLSIWGQPTKTLQYMLEHKSVGYGFIIFLLSSISTGPVAMANTGFFSGMPLAFIIIISIIIAYGGALISWVIVAALYTWIGKWLGGRGKFSDMIRITPASAILMIWLAPMNFLLVAVYGSQLYEAPTDIFSVTNLPIGVYLLQNLIMTGVGIYGTVITCKGIGLVHGFSAWRGLGVVAIFLGIGLVLAIVFSIIIGLALFSLFTTLG